MNRNVIFGILAVIVILGLAGFFGRNYLSPNSQNPNATPSSVDMNQDMSSETTTPATEESNMTTNAEGVKEITITNSGMRFNQNEIRVNQGDKVKITFKNTGGTHDVTIDEFNVRTEVIDSGEEDSVEFTADKTGSFEFYCSVMNHRQMGMKGMLIVE